VKKSKLIPDLGNQLFYFLVIFVTTLSEYSLYHVIFRLFVNSELKIVWKKAVVALFGEESWALS